MTDHKSILLIDDDAALLMLLGSAFDKAGYAVCTALDGRDGMAIFAAVVPDVVVSDIVMPTQEGIETIMAMKKARPDVVIVAMSGGGTIAGDTFLTMARHLGADDVIAKPFRPATLVALVNARLASTAASA